MTAIARVWWPGPALLLDAALVTGFATVGRSVHEEPSPLLGALSTAWPFLVGTGLGWLLVRAFGKGWPVRVGPGITVWFVTLVVGMLLRRLTGLGTALPFVLVAAGALALLLVGWRLLVDLARRRYAAQPGPARTRRPSGAG